MATRHPLRATPAPRDTASMAPGSARDKPGPAPEAIATRHLAQGQPAMAAATLLPLLDAAAAAGHDPSGAAAALIRMLLAPHPASDGGLSPGDEQLAAALARLTALVRQQDAQIAQLQAMLEALL